MTTYTFPAGRFQGTLNNAATTVFDAVTNNPFFLSDFDTYRSSGETGTSTTLAYPLRIDAAQPGFVFNGGRFYGNIDADIDWDNFYEGGRFTLSSTFPRFNSALLFPRNGVRGTFNDTVFGIRDDLNSGYVDGMRINLAGDTIMNRFRVWIGRDDFIEADGSPNGRTHTINDSFFENLFVWISCTGNVPNSFFFVNRSIVHFGRWPFRGNLNYGAPLKVDGATSSPKFRFSDTCLVIGTNDYTDKNRMKNALRNTQATNGCRLLVLGGRHVDRELIQLYQNAGFSVLEDGTGDSATVEWQNRKAAFLDETSPPVVTTPTLTSPTTFLVTVGAGPVLPVLSSPTGAQTGQATADGGVTSDTATGTIYAGVWPAAENPNEAAIKAGTGATYHTSDATPTAGVNSFSATGLTAGTAYRWSFYQEDGDGDPSSIVRSAEFTTAAPSLVQPVILSVVITGTNDPVGSFSAGYPAHEEGDGIFVATANDYNVGFLGAVNVTAPGGETVYPETNDGEDPPAPIILGNQLGNNTEQTLAWHSFVANATRAASDTGIICDATGGVDQYLVAVVRVQKDTFKDTAPRMGSITKTQENTTASQSATAAISAAQEKSTVIAAFNYAFNPPTGGAPAGWTQHALTDIGAVVLQILSRNAATTASENVAAVTVSANTNSNWIGTTGLILPKGA